MTGGNTYIFGRERYSAKTVTLVTVVTALPPVIGFWGTFDVARGFFASTYLAVFLLWYLIIQPKLVCTNCSYYDRVCARGLGKVSASLYRAGTGHDVWGTRLSRIFWPYWYAVVPALGFLYLLISSFSWPTVIFAAAFGATTVVAFFVRRNYCCVNCLIRDSCPRSPFGE